MVQLTKATNYWYIENLNMYGNVMNVYCLVVFLKVILTFLQLHITHRKLLID